MLVVQQNCGKGYECTISALETALSLGASMVCIQKPFIGNRTISHSGFNLYWPTDGGNRKDVRVLTTIRKDIANEVLLDNRSDLASNPYCLVLDVRELHPKTRKPIRKTRVVNMYDGFLEILLRHVTRPIVYFIRNIPWQSYHFEVSVTLRLITSSSVPPMYDNTQLKRNFNLYPFYHKFDSN